MAKSSTHMAARSAEKLGTLLLGQRLVNALHFFERGMATASPKWQTSNKKRDRQMYLCSALLHFTEAFGRVCIREYLGPKPPRKQARADGGKEDLPQRQGTLGDSNLEEGGGGTSFGQLRVWVSLATTWSSSLGACLLQGRKCHAFYCFSIYVWLRTLERVHTTTNSTRRMGVVGMHAAFSQLSILKIPLIERYRLKIMAVADATV